MVNSLRLIKWIKKQILLWKGNQVHKRFEQFFESVEFKIYFAHLDGITTIDLKELQDCYICQLYMHEFSGMVDFLVKEKVIDDHDTCRKKHIKEIEKRIEEREKGNWYHD